MTETAAAGIDIPAFLDAAIVRHEGARRGFALYGAGLIALGILFLLPALAVGFWPWVAGSVMAPAVSVFAFRSAIERRERIEGLEVLREEWLGMQDRSDNAAGRFLDLIKKLY